MDAINNQGDVSPQIDQYNEKMQKVFPGASDPNYISPPIWTMDTEQLSTLWELIGPEGGLTEEQQAQVDAALANILDPSEIITTFESTKESLNAEF